MTRAEPLEEEFNALALELFRVQFESVLIYRKLCVSRKRTPNESCAPSLAAHFAVP